MGIKIVFPCILEIIMVYFVDFIHEKIITILCDHGNQDLHVGGQGSVLGRDQQNGEGCGGNILKSFFKTIFWCILKVQFLQVLFL